jgi:hypothetical protein
MKAANFDFTVNEKKEFKGEKTYKKKDEMPWVKPGVYDCTIQNVLFSDDIDGYDKSPFIEFEVVTTLGTRGRCRFWSVRESDKPSAKEFKSKMLKEFLVNAGVKDFETPDAAIRAAVGRSLVVCFIKEEYVGQQDGMPAIREAVKYRFSREKGAVVQFKNEWNRPLSPEKRKEFVELSSSMSEAMQAMSEKFDTEVISTSHDDEDLPF